VEGDGSDITYQVWGSVHLKQSPSTSIPIGLMRFRGSTGKAKSSCLHHNLTDTSVRVNMRPAVQDNSTTWTMELYKSVIAQTWPRSDEEGIRGIDEESTYWVIEPWLVDVEDRRNQLV